MICLINFINNIKIQKLEFQKFAGKLLQIWDDSRKKVVSFFCVHCLRDFSARFYAVNFPAVGEQAGTIARSLEDPLALEKTEIILEHLLYRSEMCWEEF